MELVGCVAISASIAAYVRIWQNRPERRAEPFKAHWRTFVLCIFIEYSIDAAHYLPKVPADHKCGGMHGHRYEIRIEVAGERNELGWIIDYAEARSGIDPFIEKLDHATLNLIPGLENPTCENIVLWLRDRLHGWLKGLSKIEVRETARAGVVWTKTN
jgi:6-pyruvoyltetrahydropterin/6-carboxytetrahydropterin synthase